MGLARWNRAFHALQWIGRNEIRTTEDFDKVGGSGLENTKRMIYRKVFIKNGSSGRSRLTERKSIGDTQTASQSRLITVPDQTYSFSSDRRSQPASVLCKHHRGRWETAKIRLMIHHYRDWWDARHPIQIYTPRMRRWKQATRRWLLRTLHILP